MLRLFIISHHPAANLMSPHCSVVQTLQDDGHGMILMLKPLSSSDYGKKSKAPFFSVLKLAFKIVGNIVYENQKFIEVV